MARLTKAIPVPKDWQNLTHHPLSALVDYGVGVNMDEAVAYMRSEGWDEDEAVILFEGKILDGRHKHRWAIDAGEVPQFREFIGPNAFRYVVKKIMRQHLDTSQRAMIAAAMVKHQAGRPKESGGKPPDSLPTRAQAANTLNVSEDSIKQAAVVIAHGSPELQEEVRAGQKTVNAAAEEVRALTLGPDGRHYNSEGKPVTCARCVRNGPPTRDDCFECAELRKKAGQKPTRHQKGWKRGRKLKATASKNGDEVFDLKAANEFLSRFLGELDKAAIMYGLVKPQKPGQAVTARVTLPHAGIARKIQEAKDDLIAWIDTLKKEKKHGAS